MQSERVRAPLISPELQIAQVYICQLKTAHAWCRFRAGVHDLLKQVSFI